MIIEKSIKLYYISHVLSFKGCLIESIQMGFSFEQSIKIGLQVKYFELKFLNRECTGSILPEFLFSKSTKLVVDVNLWAIII